MTKTAETRARYLTLMVKFVLKHGFARASLRPLANAAGTSDRMLIYHFGNKDALISALLIRLAEDYTGLLNRALPEAAMPSRRALMDAVLEFVRKPEGAAYIHIWQEMMSEAAKGAEMYADIGAQIVDGFVDWLERRMPVGDPNPKGAAMAMLTLIEGTHVMNGVGRAEVADLAVETFFPAP